jgi:hypothetical protein
MMKATIPSEDELNAMRALRVEGARHNKTCFTHWFPAVQALGIRHPRSEVIPFPDRLTGHILNEEFGVIDAELRAIVASIRAFGAEVGYPLFIKNSLFSGKHDWVDTCFIAEGASDERIISQIINLTHFWAICSHDLSLYLVVREFVPTKAVFHAFNGMPITAEFRLFARDGVIEGWQPYWPEHAIQEPDVENWADRLKAIEEPLEANMSWMMERASAVSSQLGGYWSIDFLQDDEGRLWLIDMAEGGRSYRCPTGYRDLMTDKA